MFLLVVFSLLSNVSFARHSVEGAGYTSPSPRRPAAVSGARGTLSRRPGFSSFELAGLKAFPGFNRLAFDGEGRVFEVIPGSLAAGDSAGIRQELMLDDGARITDGKSQALLPETLAEARDFNLSK